MPLRSFHPGQTFLSASHRTSAMSPELHWPAIAFRLVLTVLGGGLLGADRSRTGHPAGLRTTLLVAMAASVSMIQMNLLLPTNGKPADSYAVMDLMRLPLGILTGVGFIGAGAIVRKGDLVLGITTAATLWFATGSASVWVAARSFLVRPPLCLATWFSPRCDGRNTASSYTSPPRSL
jgi:uncharacterized membrane protein YhiD involved in acid resistance